MLRPKRFVRFYLNAICPLKILKILINQFFISEKVTCESREIVDWSDVVKVICNSAHCDQSGFMHAECFDKYEQIILHFLSKQGRGRTWNDKQVSA